jgi:hypothetical protein
MSREIRHTIEIAASPAVSGAGRRIVQDVTMLRDGQAGFAVDAPSPSSQRRPRSGSGATSGLRPTRVIAGSPRLRIASASVPTPSAAAASP